MTAPAPQREEWTCVGCRRVIGYLTVGGNLHITSADVPARRDEDNERVIVTCSCGRVIEFRGRRVLIDLSERTVASIVSCAAVLEEEERGLLAVRQEMRR